MKLAHLNKSAASALLLSDEERGKRILAPRWIGYPKANEVLQKLEDLLAHPKKHRMPNMLVVSDTNNGKTMLVKRFKNQHPACDNLDSDRVKIPVLMFQAPPVPDEGRFYNTILDSLFAVYKPKDPVGVKQAQAIKLLKHINVKILIIDELQHILAGSLNAQRGFLNVIKYLGNEVPVSIVGVGTKDAFRAIQTDPQLSNRFEPTVLPLWRLNQEFMRLLASFERMLPLRKLSQLHGRDIATKIYSMSEGYIGEISALLEKAAVEAVRSGEERITVELLSNLDWVGPSERKRQIEKIR